MTEEERLVAETAAATEANQQTPEQIAETERLAAEEAAKQKTIYTAEELEALHPTAIDLDRVDPAARPIVEKTIKEYKSLQADHTRKSQELSELKKTEEIFFEDPNKNSVFKDYIKNPLKVIADINGEIAKLEAVIPEDGADQYRAARRTIAQWTAIKDEFQEKRAEISEKSRQAELDEAKLVAELGADAPALLEYAKGLGFSEKDFKSKPELRAALKNTFKLSNAASSAQKKETKGSPHKAAGPSGGAGGSGGEQDIFDPNLSTEDRIALFRKNKAA
jgi:hypothetical protein